MKDPKKINYVKNAYFPNRHFPKFPRSDGCSDLTNPDFLLYVDRHLSSLLPQPLPLLLSTVQQSFFCHNPPYIEWHAKFTTIPLKRCKLKNEGDIFNFPLKIEYFHYCAFFIKRDLRCYRNMTEKERIKH